MINFNCYGLSEENYNRIIPDIKKTNIGISKNLARIFFVFMAVLYIVSLISESLEALRYTYLSLSCVFFVIATLSYFKFFEKCPTIIIYFECALVYTFTILVAYSHPDVKSTQIFIFLILLPILFGDKLYRVGIMIFTTLGIYLIVLFTCLSQSIWFMEALNGICLSIASFIIHYYLNADRCTGYLAKLEKDDVIAVEKQLTAKLKIFSEVDELTGIYNRRKLFEDLDDVIKGVAKIPNAIFMIDIDKFKEVNDTYGHIIGDSYLRRFGSVLLKNGKDNNLIAYRYGGDEFMVLVYNEDKSKLRDIAENIRNDAKKINVTKNLIVSISVGVAQCDQEKLKLYNYDNWLIKADEAVYKAKKTGHDKVVLYEEMNH